MSRPDAKLAFWEDFRKDLQKDTHSGNIGKFRLVPNGSLQVFTARADGYGWNRITQYGTVEERPAFYHQRTDFRSYGLTEFKWFLSADGPNQAIQGYFSDEGTNDLFLGFIPPVEGGGQRSLQYRNGDYFPEGNFTGNKTMLYDRSIKRLRHGSKAFAHKQTADETAIYLTSLFGRKKWERIRYPKTVDIQKWKPILEDLDDTASNDPSLPWRNWFAELGISYSNGALINGQIPEFEEL